MVHLKRYIDMIVEASPDAVRYVELLAHCANHEDEGRFFLTAEVANATLKFWREMDHAFRIREHAGVAVNREPFKKAFYGYLLAYSPLIDRMRFGSRSGCRTTIKTSMPKRKPSFGIGEKP